MRAAILAAPSTFEIRQVDPPDEVSGWTAIDVAACGVCGSDLAIYDRNPPIPRYWPGHEISGFHDGQLVVVNPLIFCGRCEFCTTGRENLCANTKMISHHAPGGFAERVFVPVSQLRAIDTTPARAACIEPLASSLHGLGVAGPLEGRAVTIVGGGTLGLLLVQLCRMQGAREVSLRARHTFQQRLGEAWGASLEDHEPDVVLLAAAGDGEALQWAADHTRPQGRVVMMGNIYQSRPLNLKWLVERELCVVGSQRYTADEFETAAELVESGRIDMDPLVTHRFPLSEISTAYATAQSKAEHASIKVLVTPRP